MEYILKTIRKSLIFSIVSVAIFSLVFGNFAIGVLAQSSQPSQPSQTPSQAAGLEGTQAASVVEGNQDTQSNFDPQALAEATAYGLGGCVQSIASGFISGYVSKLLYTASHDGLFYVPTTGSQDNARAGDSTGWPPSKDSIAYCIINAMIEYIADATIEWINSGFDGNPAFVDNPQQFFSDIADIEAAGFLQEVVYNSTGLNVCEPFRVELQTGLSNGLGYGRGNQFQCTLGDIADNAENFDVYLSGQSPYSGSYDDLWNMSQNPQNNRLGSYFLRQDELAERIYLQQNTAQIDMTLGGGFLSFKQCSEDGEYTDEDGVSHSYKGACAITTPGKIIEEQANKTLGAGTDRLVLADKFDQVVTTLINQLIKTALSQVLNNTGE